MLFLSHTYESFNETFWQINRPAFDPTKKELKSVSMEYQGPLIIRLEEIASHINKLSKPIYTDIDKFYNCFRNIMKINELFGDKSKELINTEHFRLAFKPSQDELEKKIWAIHVSDYLWPDAIIRPFLKEIGSQKHANGISLTIHFSLGEMVRPHSRVHHWKYCQVAVLVPIGELTKQLISIYPYDTVLKGCWKIAPKAIVIIPKKMSVPEAYLHEKIKVVNYDPKKNSLRKTIKSQIIEQKGIYLKMIRNVLFPGAPAYLYENKAININREEFFESILQGTDISFGSDSFTTNNRDGFNFGNLRQLSIKIAENPSSSRLWEFYHYFQFSYEKISKHLTLNEKIRINSFIDQFKIFDLPENYIPYASTDLLSNLNESEFNDFKIKYPRFFHTQTKYIIDAAWAVKRWLLLGDELGTKECLENIYKKNLSFFFTHQKGVLNTDIIDAISLHLEGESERAKLALYILSLEETRDYNFCVALQICEEQKRGFKIASRDGSFLSTDYSTDSIESVLSKHSKTHLLFDDDKFLPMINQIHEYLKDKNNPSFDYENLELFIKISPIHIETDEKILKNSFSKACHAIEFAPNSNLKKEIYETKMNDLTSVSNSLLLFWKSSYGIKQLWNRFSLEEEFNKSFPSEEMFWESSLTFIEIYRMLKGQISNDV